MRPLGRLGSLELSDGDTDNDDTGWVAGDSVTDAHRIGAAQAWCCSRKFFAAPHSASVLGPHCAPLLPVRVSALTDNLAVIVHVLCPTRISAQGAQIRHRPAAHPLGRVVGAGPPGYVAPTDDTHEVGIVADAERTAVRAAKGAQVGDVAGPGLRCTDRMLRYEQHRRQSRE